MEPIININVLDYEQVTNPDDTIVITSIRFRVIATAGPGKREVSEDTVVLDPPHPVAGGDVALFEDEAVELLRQRAGRVIGEHSRNLVARLEDRGARRAKTVRCRERK